MERRQIRFRGAVQGVGFRATAASLAGAFAISGWVVNEADGSVLLECQGEDREIDSFLGALRERLGRNIRGSTTSAVPTVQAETGFHIRR